MLQIMNELIKKKIILIFLISLTFGSCVNNEYAIPEDIEVQDFVWKGFNAYYLYQDEIPDLSDRRFNSNQQLESYLKGFETPVNLFNSLVLPTDVRSTLIEDHSILDFPVPKRSFNTNGMEFGIFKAPTSPDNLIGYVSHILPLSYASDQDISRGEFFYAVLNQDLESIPFTEENYEELLINYQQDTLKLLMADFDGNSLVTNNKRVDLVKKPYQYPSVFMNKILDFNSQKIGYLMYNNDFSKNYIEDLNATMLEFKNELVEKLIVDLRYNIGQGSYAETIAEIASMLSGQTTGEILFKKNWNLKAQSWFEQNQPDSLITKFSSKLFNSQPINSLNLTDVYIVLNGNNFEGSSAIELLINSLQPYINVHIIGNKTKGDNLGSITLYDSPDYDFFGKKSSHSFALQPSTLTFTNLNDESYENGFFPVIELCSEEDPLNLGVLGEITDPILNQILNYISGNTGINSPCNPFDFEIIYNSINSQRPSDNGIFIRQDLPNLGR